MNVIAGIGVEVTPVGLRAVAVGVDGDVMGEQQFDGIAGADELSAALGRVVGALGGREVPVALAWDDGHGGAAVGLGRGRPVELAAQLQRWAAAGTEEVTVVVDDDGARWAVAQGPTAGVDRAVRQSAERAGLMVVGSEPAVVARARRAGASVAESMAAVATGRLAPPVRWSVPTMGTAPDRLVWVIERSPDDGPGPGTADDATGWSRLVLALRRAIAATRPRD